MRDSASSTTPFRDDDELLAVGTELAATVDGVAIVELSASPAADAESPVAFRLVTALPDAASLDDVEVHDDRDGGRWRSRPDDHALQFEAVVSPDETLSTRYGVRLAGGLEPHQAVTEVDVEIAKPAPREAATDDPPIFRHAAGQPVGSTVKALLDAPTAATSVDEVTFENDSLEDPNTSGLGADDGRMDATTSADGADSSDEYALVDGEGSVEREDLVAALVRAFERGDLSDEQREAVRSTLGVVSDRSTRAHVRHLQGRVEEVLAYAGALEEFIDGEGTAEQIIDDLRADLERLAARQDELESSLEETDDLASRTHGRIDDVEGDVETLDSDVTDIWGALGTVRGDIEELETEVGYLREELAALTDRREEDLSAFEDEVFHLQDVYEQDIDQLETVLRSRIAEVEDSLDTELDRVEEKHDEEVDELKSLIDSSVDRLEEGQEELQARQDDLAESVDEIDAWRASFVAAIDGMHPD